MDAMTISEINDDMRSRIAALEAAAIKCEIRKPDGDLYSWREWFAFLGFREDGYPLNG